MNDNNQSNNNQSDRPPRRSRNGNRRRRNSHRRKSTGEGQSQSQSSQQQTSNDSRPGQGGSRGSRKQRNKNYRGQGNQRHNNKQTGNNPRRNTSPRSPTKTRHHPSDVVSIYLDFMSRYLNARKEYYGSYNVANERKRRHLYNQYIQCLQQLRNYETKLHSEKLETLQAHVDGFPNDTKFSSHHPQDEIGNPADIENEQLRPLQYFELLSQKERPQYEEDTEESSGSIDDYYAYKGITPPSEIKQ
ncbi:MAG: hypothetical protein H6621_11870 [Halobacteriovoraceae bacterium]|nr:hypothetical protein [Halobacteriovoraceae bacterium]MCB9095758.1 hypothetical protein [Halobacteriovoraceae bacterium]